ncbi:hypothetical protein IU11_00090 [Cellulosimicrobium sp. MM]|nr:hypothetical protein IU11_00090 [Cellulosimicrobium sp. MM]
MSSARSTGSARSPRPRAPTPATGRTRAEGPPSGSGRSGTSAGLNLRSAARTAAGVACAPVGESDVRQAGTPSSATSTASPVGPGQSPARGHEGSCGRACASSLTVSTLAARRRPRPARTAP